MEDVTVGEGAACAPPAVPPRPHALSDAPPPPPPPPGEADNPWDLILASKQQAGEDEDEDEDGEPGREDAGGEDSYYDDSTTDEEEDGDTSAEPPLPPLAPPPPPAPRPRPPPPPVPDRRPRPGRPPTPPRPGAAAAAASPDAEGGPARPLSREGDEGDDHVSEFLAGSLVEALYSDGHYYRAVVRSALGAGRVRVEYVGYGEEAVVDVGDVRAPAGPVAADEAGHALPPERPRRTTSMMQKLKEMRRPAAAPSPGPAPPAVPPRPPSSPALWRQGSLRVLPSHLVLPPASPPHAVAAHVKRHAGGLVLRFAAVRGRALELFLHERARQPYRTTRLEGGTAAAPLPDEVLPCGMVVAGLVAAAPTPRSRDAWVATMQALARGAAPPHSRADRAARTEVRIERGPDGLHRAVTRAAAAAARRTWAYHRYRADAAAAGALNSLRRVHGHDSRREGFLLLRVDAASAAEAPAAGTAAVLRYAVALRSAPLLILLLGPRSRHTTHSVSLAGATVRRAGALSVVVGERPASGVAAAAGAGDDEGVVRELTLTAGTEWEADAWAGVLAEV